MRSPSQWPGSIRSSTSSGRSAIGRYSPSGLGFWACATLRRPTAPGAPRQLRPGAGGQAAARVVRVARPVDGLRAHAHARLAQVRRRGVRGPAQLQALIDRGGQHPIDRQLGRSLSSRPRACRRVRPAGVIARPPGAAGQLAMHRGPITAQPLRYVRDAATHPERRLDEHPLIQTQPRCHTRHLHRSAACVRNGHHDRSLATTDGVRPPTDTRVLVICHMTDGHHFGGHLAWYNTDTEETVDRDIILAPPFLHMPPDSTENVAPEEGRMILSARNILRIHVIYLSKPSED